MLNCQVLYLNKFKHKKKNGKVLIKWDNQKNNKE